jgi:hypothetical protein
MTLKFALAACLAAAAMTFVACGDDDDESGEKEASAVALSILATDKAIEAPKSVEAGLVEITLENNGKDDHEAQLIEVRDGHTAQDALKVITGDEEDAPIPDWLLGAGGVGTTEAGETETTTQTLAPGTYALIDTTGDKPVTDVLEVTGEAADGELPGADGTITATEYAFETSGVKAGSNTLRFENAGDELHHVVPLAVKADATAESIEQFFKTEKGPPPFRGREEDTDGTAVLDGGQSQVTQLTVPKGNVAFVCFIPDRAGGPPHAAKGMITVEEIK